ncbi:MAG: PulJ/GspJ family protein [Kiritimatiellia bacterium]
MKNFPQPVPRSLNSRQGFTLVEVLVSSFLTLIVLGMLFAVLVGTMNAWQGGTNRLKSSGDARLALDILKTDLESMVVRQTQYNQEWLSSRPFEDQVSKFINSWVTFFSPSLDREAGQQGDIVAVSYLSWYQDPIAPGIAPSEQVKIYGLYKAMTTTEEAFNNALNYGNDALLTEEGGGTQGYWTNAPTRPELNDINGFLAPNVIRFTVHWMVRKPGDTELTRVDENHYVRLSNTLNVYGTNGFTGGKIEAAEIFLTTLSDEGMRRYAFFAKNGSVSAQQTQNIIREFGRTHSIRVPINY